MTAGVGGKTAARGTGNTVNEAKHTVPTPPLSDESNMIVIHPPLSQPLLDHPHHKYGKSSKWTTLNAVFELYFYFPC